MSRVSPVVQLSIDLGLQSDQTALLQHQQFETVAQNLLAWISEYRIPTTWALPFPADSNIVPTLQRLDAPQEIALLANSSWADSSIGRGTFARELASRLNAARQEDIVITTLAASDTDVTENFDLIAKHQLSMVRVGVARRSRRRSIEAIRHGVWRVAPTMSFPVVGHMEKLGWNLAQRRLRRPRTGVEHVRIAACDLLEANRGTWRTLDQFLRKLSKLADANEIRLQTLSETAADLKPTREHQPARSILRPAA